MYTEVTTSIHAETEQCRLNARFNLELGRQRRRSLQVQFAVPILLHLFVQTEQLSIA
jgi:hypothetical protein